MEKDVTYESTSHVTNTRRGLTVSQTPSAATARLAEALQLALRARPSVE
jgi:hypothetical protein